MSIHFHPLKVKELRKETPECVTIVFEVPEQLVTDFKFIQGQNLTIKKTINGQELRRTYSLCTSPLDNEWRVAVKQIEGGLFSQYANNELQVGDVLEVLSPAGKFYTELSNSQKKKYLAICAGSGITPILSIIKTTLQVEPESHFTLVYGNRTRNSIMFFDELEALKNKYINRLSIIHVLSRETVDTPIHNGRIDTEKMEALNRLVNYAGMDEIFLCGPEGLTFGAKSYLEGQGIDHHKIHLELFTTPVSNKSGEDKKVVAAPVNSNASLVTIKLDGRSFDFELPYDETILDAALDKGLDLPYGCRGGVCCSCKALVREGEVNMDENWGLEDDDVEKGFVLTCQSYPTTPRVVVDFDVK